MEKEKNETESERKSDTSLKGTVIAFIILLILAIAAFLCEKMDNAIFTAFVNKKLSHLANKKVSQL